MADGEPVRFTALLNTIVGISQEMLTKNLRALKRDGVVIRTVYPSEPSATATSATRQAAARTRPRTGDAGAVARTQQVGEAVMFGPRVRVAQDAEEAVPLRRR